MDPKTPLSNRYNQRAPWHNYRGRSIYMITITRAKAHPDFSIISGSPLKPEIHLTPLGEAVENELRNFAIRYEEISLYRSVIMPDHIHFVLAVTRSTPYHIGDAIKTLKAACSRRFWTLYPGCKDPLFKSGFHDRILLQSGQLDIMKAYVRDNPRRYLIKKLNPQYFNQKVTLIIDGEYYHALGNIFLLRNIMIEQVRVSRQYSPAELKSLEARWKFTIEEGGALVSPFISPKEKVFRDLAINNGGNLIMIEENGFSERFKPGGRYFDLCAMGRLLMVAPIEHHPDRRDMDRQLAMELNEIAAKIASGKFDVSLRPNI